MTRRVVIIGGGVAGLEALFALHDLAADRVEITLVSPEPDFLYRPMLVEEPFGLGPAEQHALGPVVEELGARFEQRAVTAVSADRHSVALDDGSALEYDYLMVCVGGRSRPAFEAATTFPGKPGTLAVDDLLGDADEQRRVALVVPPGVVWALPIYELALMTDRRAVELRCHIEMTVYTSEPAPLAVFGPTGSAAVSDLLSARGIEVVTDAFIHEEEGELVITPGDGRIAADAVVALPVTSGPGIPGLPADAGGFIPIDEYGRVLGVDDVYAAGDGTNFPIKQGGLGAQQADGAAAHLAHRLGAAIAVEPFHPVLRGQLLTGDESLYLRTDVTGGAGEGEATWDCLWWPTQKISARYLSRWLARTAAHLEIAPPPSALEVEVALPRDWHREPMTSLSPYWPRRA